MSVLFDVFYKNVAIEIFPYYLCENSEAAKIN